jgi:hypothetical protein
VLTSALTLNHPSIHNQMQAPQTAIILSHYIQSCCLACTQPKSHLQLISHHHHQVTKFETSHHTNLKPIITIKPSTMAALLFNHHHHHNHREHPSANLTNCQSPCSIPTCKSATTISNSHPASSPLITCNQFNQAAPLSIAKAPVVFFLAPHKHPRRPVVHLHLRSAQTHLD